MVILAICCVKPVEDLGRGEWKLRLGWDDCQTDFNQPFHFNLPISSSPPLSFSLHFLFTNHDRHPKNPISFFGNGHYCYSQFEDFEGGPALHLHHSSILLWYVSPSHQLYSTFIATSGILQQCVSPMFATRCPIHLAFFRQMPLSFGTGSLVCLVNGAL